MNRTTVWRRRAAAALAVAAVVTTGLSACTLDVAQEAEAGTPGASAAAADPSDQDPGDSPAAADGSRPVLTTALDTGDCLGELASSGKADEVGLVACTTPHAAQVGGTFIAEGESWPGVDALQTSALVGCPIAVADAVGSATSSLDYLFITPEEDEWDGGHHLVICLVQSTDGGPLTGSAIS